LRASDGRRDIMQGCMDTIDGQFDHVWLGGAGKFGAQQTSEDANARLNTVSLKEAAHFFQTSRDTFLRGILADAKLFADLTETAALNKPCDDAGLFLCGQIVQRVIDPWRQGGPIRLCFASNVNELSGLIFTLQTTVHFF
jgi:hypothetical protein